MELANRIEFAYNDLDEAFPDVNPNFEPFGSLVLVQIRLAMKMTKSGLHLPPSSRDTETWNTQVAKVLSMGPVAYCDRKTLVKWPEGEWAQVGEYVRVPKYGGDRWTVSLSTDDEVMFAVFNDLELRGRIPDPLNMKAFL